MKNNLLTATALTCAVGFAAAGLTAAGFAGTAMAEGPAVSGLNAKISAGGGDTDGDTTGLGLLSITLPIGDSFGFQLDGLGGEIDSKTRWGAAAHLFWRDPDKGLLGVVGSYDYRDDDHDSVPDSMGRGGVEGELYLGRFTGLARGGYQFGEVEDGAFGRIDLRWYATDDIWLSAGGEVVADDDSDYRYVGRFAAEYQPGFSALPGLSLFAVGEVGEDDWDRVFAGIRFYFGETKSLIRRHRMDDPGNMPRDHDFGLGGYAGGAGGVVPQ